MKAEIEDLCDFSSFPLSHPHGIAIVLRPVWY